MPVEYPVHSDPEKVDRRRWVYENLAAIPVDDEGLPKTISGVIRAVVHLAKPDRVVLFGSRARNDAHRLSNFDLYVEGIRDRRGFRTAVLDATTGYLTLRALDIVPDFEASAELRAEVAREGKVLFERSKEEQLSTGSGHVRELPCRRGEPGVASYGDYSKL